MAERPHRFNIFMSDDERRRVDALLEETGHDTVASLARHLFKEEWKRRGHPDPSKEGER